MHKETIDKVPNSLKGRDNINLEIYGMENVPEADIIEHEKRKSSSNQNNKEEYYDSDSESEKSPKDQTSQIAPPPPPGPSLPPLPPPPIPQIPPPNHYPAMSPSTLPTLPQQMTHLNRPQFPQQIVNPLLMQQQQQQHMLNPMLLQYPGQMLPGYMGGAVGINSLLVQQHNILYGQQPAQLKPPNQPQPFMPVGLSHSFLPASLQANSQTFIPIAPTLPSNSRPISNIISTQKPRKIENIPPGCILVHPEEDISLEEYRARLTQFKNSKT